MPRMPADIRISLKERGGPTQRSELVRQPVGKRYWTRRDGKDSAKVPEASWRAAASCCFRSARWSDIRSSRRSSRMIRLESDWPVSSCKLRAMFFLSSSWAVMARSDSARNCWFRSSSCNIRYWSARANSPMSGSASCRWLISRYSLPVWIWFQTWRNSFNGLRAVLIIQEFVSTLKVVPIKAKKMMREKSAARSVSKRVRRVPPTAPNMIIMELPKTIRWKIERLGKRCFIRDIPLPILILNEYIIGLGSGHAPEFNKRPASKSEAGHMV